MAVIKKLATKWKDRAAIGDEGLSRQELDFLPAALEIKEKPPHPASRITSFILLGLFTIGVVWACFGEVDIVATAEGKIIPSGKVKVIQPYERGVVANILVIDGQHVSKGEPLIELDQGQTGANQKRLEQELVLNRLNHLRITQFLEFIEQADSNINNLASLDAETTALVDEFKEGYELIKNVSFYQQKQQETYLEQQKSSYIAQNAQLGELIQDKLAEKQVNYALIKKLRNTLPLITQRVDALKTLMKKKMGSRVQYLELEQERVEQQQDLVGAQAREQQIIAQVNELREKQKALVSDLKQNNWNELIAVDREYYQLREEFLKAKDLNKKQILSSPIDGIVQELAIHTVGGVVTPAQELMKVVPKANELEVEAWLENKDIGFVHEGFPTEIKIHTFPFTKYGVIDAEVKEISTDAIQHEQKGLLYKAQVRLHSNRINVDGRNVNLTSGMAVSAEINIGKRYLIEYILSPLFRYKSESLLER